MTEKARLLPAPTLSGTRAIEVGASTYMIPESAGVARGDHGNVVFVLSAGKIHAFTEAGEISIPGHYREDLARFYFAGGRRR